MGRPNARQDLREVPQIAMPAGRIHAKRGSRAAKGQDEDVRQIPCQLLQRGPGRDVLLAVLVHETKRRYRGRLERRATCDLEGGDVREGDHVRRDERDEPEVDVQAPHARVDDAVAPRLEITAVKFDKRVRGVAEEADGVDELAVKVAIHVSPDRGREVERGGEQSGLHALEHVDAVGIVGVLRRVEVEVLEAGEGREGVWESGVRGEDLVGVP